MTLIPANDCRGPDGDCVCGPYTAPELWCLFYSRKLVREAEANGARRAAHANATGRAAASQARWEASHTREVRNVNGAKVGRPKKVKK